MSVDLIELDKDMFAWSKTQPLLTSLNKNSFADFQEHTMPNYNSVRDTLNSLEETKGNRVFFTDANNFINAYVQSGLKPSYDIIIIDLPDPYSLGINKMYTEQFYKRLYALLKEDGVIVTQATSPFHAPLAFATIGKTFESAGFHAKPYHYNIPSFGEWGWWLASRNEITFKSLHADTEFLTNELASASFNFGKNELITGDNIESNTLMHPVLVRIYNKESWTVD
jgi:spermidine synthase